MMLLLAAFVAFVVWIAIMWFMAGADLELQPDVWKRRECDCEECMEPGLRGPGRTSLDW